MSFFLRSSLLPSCSSPLSLSSRSFLGVEIALEDCDSDREEVVEGDEGGGELSRISLLRSTKEREACDRMRREEGSGEIEDDEEEDWRMGTEDEDEEGEEGEEDDEDGEGGGDSS